MWSNDHRANLPVLPDTDRDIEHHKLETSYEVGLFDLIVTIRKPMCKVKDKNGLKSQKPASIEAHLLTDPLRKFSTSKKNFQAKYHFQDKMYTKEGVNTLVLKLSLEDQKEIFRYFTALDQGNLMYTETAIPVGELLVRGSCEEGDDEMPIDLITVQYANRVPSTRQDKLTDHAYVENYINGVHGSYRSETLVTF